MAFREQLEKYHEILVAALGGFITFAILKIIEDSWHEVHITLAAHLILEFGIAFTIYVIVSRRVDAQKKLEVLNRETRQLHETIQNTTSSALLSQQTTQNFHKIQSQYYDPSISAVVKELEASQEGLGLSLDAIVERTSSRMLELIEDTPHWRILIERLFGAYLTNIENNNYVLSLETYCNLIIDTIKVGLNRAQLEGKKFIVYSFTNVTPKDWFLEREVIGNPLIGYAKKVREVVESMREGGHTFKRHVVCKGEKIESDQDSMIGFPSFKEVELNWMNCDHDERTIYLNDYHTAPEEAQIIALEIPGLKFFHNCTEFVFFGMVKDGNSTLDSIEWWLCFGAGYTNNNVNVSASFVNLEKQFRSHLIDVPNTSSLILDEGTRIMPQKIVVPFKDFPQFMLLGNERYSRTYRFRNLLTLAMKWHLASEIWHSFVEDEFVSDFLQSQIPSKEVAVLDCACGTGRHSVMLKKLGYKVVAADYSKDNLDIFSSIQQQENLEIEMLHANWMTLQDDLGSRKFDVIICLGTSLPYYKSWKENGIDYVFEENELLAIIKNFKDSLNKDGKLIIGLSRHVNKGLSGTELNFIKKNIVGSLSGVRDAEYEMTWRFEYDWDRRKRLWECDIRNDHNDDLSFKLVSHLFDITELHDYCKTVFGERNARIEDLNTNNYDMYVVCELREDGSITS